MPVRNAKGGITQYALRNWEYICKAKFHFDWVTLDSELSFEKELIKQGCKVYHISSRQEEDEARFKSEMEEILTSSYSYDAIHLHTSFWRGFLAEELAIKAKVPRIIVHAHSTGVDVINYGERTRLMQAHNEWRQKFSMSLATHFTACSAAAANFLFGPQIPRERITILKNAIDINRFAYNADIRSEIRLSMGLNGKFVVLQTGRLVYQKNHSFTLEVFAQFSKHFTNAILLFAGDGSLCDSLHSEADEYGISDKVYFLGFRNDIPQLLHAADILVMPSRFEGLGIAAIEAQCSGIFCLLSEHVPVETVVVSSSAIRMKLDVNLWSSKISDIARNGYYRSDCSTVVAMAGYSLRDQVNVLEKIYAG